MSIGTLWHRIASALGPGALSDADLAYLRERHRERLERRVGPDDRRQAPREPARPLDGRAYAFGGRRATDAARGSPEDE